MDIIYTAIALAGIYFVVTWFVDSRISDKLDSIEAKVHSMENEIEDLRTRVDEVEVKEKSSDYDDSDFL